MAKLLDAKLRGRATHHRTLVRNLIARNNLRNTVFVSTNYDILIDNAMTEEPERGFDLDYGVEFRNFEQTGEEEHRWRRPARWR